MRRKWSRYLFEVFLSIDTTQVEEHKQFMSNLCPFPSSARVKEICQECDLCDLQGFIREQNILRPLVAAFLENKAFTLEDVEVLNKKLERLINPIITWEYRDETLKQKEEKTGWRYFEKVPRQLTEHDVVLLRGFRYGNPLGAVYYSFFRAISTPIITLDARILTAEELRRKEPKITAYRKKLEQEYSIPRPRIPWGGKKPEVKAELQRKRKEIHDYVNIGGSINSAAKIFGYSRTHIRRIIREGK